MLAGETSRGGETYRGGEAPCGLRWAGVPHP